MNHATEDRLGAFTSTTEAREPLSAIERESNSWWPAIEWCIVAVLAVGFIWYSFVPAWQSLKSEFPNYYLAAKLYHQGIPLDRVYEWTWFQRQNDHLGVRDGLVSFAPNPPTSILVLLPLTALGPLTAKRVWLVLSLLFLVACVIALHRTTTLGWRRLVLIALLCVLPLGTDFLYARHYVFLLMLICIAYYLACRSHHRASGVMWAAAAAVKLFPALALILFVRKRNWRSVAGFVIGGIAIATVSVVLFGAEVHREFVNEVLSQAFRGDWLGPYALSQNSFITLWSHLFLVEPELNPSPWINSPTLFAMALAATTTVILLAFLWSTKNEKQRQSLALHWAAVVPLLLLLSTTTAADHSCLLIFSAIVGIDALLAGGQKERALVLLLLYAIACAPIPERFLNWFPLSRLFAITALYGLLLSGTASLRRSSGRLWLAVGLVTVALLTLYNLHTVRYRGEDFSRRLPSGRNAFRFANPVPVGDQIAFTEMQANKYGIALLAGSKVRDVPFTDDALSLAGSGTSRFLYSELTGRRSMIVKIPTDPPSVAQTVTEGQEPALSQNGKWLAFVREEKDGSRAVLLLATDSSEPAHSVLPNAYRPLDITVTDDGDIIAAAGSVSDPRLFLVKRSGGEVVMLPAVRDPARYPSISPDGKRLAFSLRERGSWHLVVRDLADGREQLLTHVSCNAISPSWANNQTLFYATDCGRGVGLSAIARVELPE